MNLDDYKKLIPAMFPDKHELVENFIEQVWNSGATNHYITLNGLLSKKLCMFITHCNRCIPI